MAPERDNAMRFSALFLPPTCYDDTASQNLLVKIYSFKETDLKGGFVLRDSHLQADARIDKGEEKRSNPNYPPHGAAVGYSPVSGTYVLAGGYLRNDSRAFPMIPTAYVWSFSPAASASRSTHTWGKSATMKRHRSSALAIPYDDGKIYIFGGDLKLPPSLEIYDPRSGSVSPPLVFPLALFPHCKFVPLSYFLWKDNGSEPHPLIMLHLVDTKTLKHLLLSFNVQAGRLEMFDPNFLRLKLEPWTTRIVPLDGINTLLITVHPDHWLVYDMSSKKQTGVVRVLDFKLDRDHRQVRHAFSRRCLDGSHIVYIFMDGYQHDYHTSQFSVPYAVFRVRKVEGEFTAALESRGALGNDECSHFFIFPTHPKEAPDLLPEEAPDLPLLGHECRLGKRRRWLMCAGGGGVVTSLIFLFNLYRQKYHRGGGS